jgi:hypothetical protein
MKTLKQCKGCAKTLSLEAFYAHSRMSDGHLNFCRECVKAKVQHHRTQNIERINEYDRKRSNNPDRKAQLRALTERHLADPVRAKATRATSNAIRDGKLIRPDSCSACKKSCKPDAHHDDYSEPLNVRWLCRSCHCKHHRKVSLSLPF